MAVNLCDIKSTYERQKNVIIYSSLESCQVCTETGEVLLGIIIEVSGNEHVYCLCRLDSGIGLYEVNFKDNFGYHRYGLWYTEISLQKLHQKIDSTKDLDQHTFQFCIGIPDFCRNSNTGKFLYTFLSKNWTCRKQIGKFMLPNISKIIIDSYNNKP